MQGIDSQLAAVLYEAAASPIGLVCQVEPSFEKGRAKLYQTRTKIADPELLVLQFRAAPEGMGGNLLIVKERITTSAEA